MRFRRRAALAMVWLLCVSLAGCTALQRDEGGENAAGPGQSRLTVGGGQFTEVLVLQALYGNLLQQAGFEVDYRAESGRQVYVPLLRTGEIDVVPEYAATLTEYLNHEVNGASAPTVASRDVAATVATLSALARRGGLQVLRPAAAASQNGFAVSRAFAARHDITTLSQLAALGPVRLAATAQCADRPFCQLGLQRVYQLRVSELLPLGYGTAATKQAVVDGRADVALVATTDGTIGDLGLVLLRDDRGLQLADNVVPVVNALSAGTDRVAAALDPLHRVLSTADLAALNEQVEGGRQTPQVVARRYLAAAGLDQRPSRG